MIREISATDKQEPTNWIEKDHEKLGQGFRFFRLDPVSATLASILAVPVEAYIRNKLRFHEKRCECHTTTTARLGAGPRDIHLIRVLTYRLIALLSLPYARSGVKDRTDRSARRRQHSRPACSAAAVIRPTDSRSRMRGPTGQVQCRHR